MFIFYRYVKLKHTEAKKYSQAVSKQQNWDLNPNLTHKAYFRQYVCLIDYKADKSQIPQTLNNNK